MLRYSREEEDRAAIGVEALKTEHVLFIGSRAERLLSVEDDDDCDSDDVNAFANVNVAARRTALDRPGGSSEASDDVTK